MHDYSQTSSFRAFQIQPGAENYAVFVEFVYDILNTTYLNFENLVKYQGNADFENANFLLIAREMESLIPLVAPNYLRIMTEVIEDDESMCNYFNYFPCTARHVSKFKSLFRLSESIRSVVSLTFQNNMRLCHEKFAITVNRNSEINLKHALHLRYAARACLLEMA